MNPLLSHPLFAGMVSVHVQKILESPRLTCDFCSFSGTDPKNFGDDKKTCRRCQEYLDCMQAEKLDLDEITRRFGLLGSIQALEKSVGNCAPVAAVLLSFKNFFVKLRSIPEIRQAISESLEDARRKKESSDD